MEGLETNDYYTKFMYCYQTAKWDVEYISKKNEANGYIVQMVKMKIETNDNVKKEEQYFEAWKVENGLCCKFDSEDYDDVFGVGKVKDDAFNELKFSIGKFGESCFEGTIFWVDKSDKLYEEVDKWKPGGVDEAVELKSIEYSTDLWKMFKDKVCFSREPFAHKWNMTKEEVVFNVICEYIYKMCDGYDKKLQKMKLHNYVYDLLSEDIYNMKQKVLEKMTKRLEIDDV